MAIRVDGSRKMNEPLHVYITDLTTADEPFEDLRGALIGRFARIQRAIGARHGEDFDLGDGTEGTKRKRVEIARYTQSITSYAMAVASCLQEGAYNAVLSLARTTCEAMFNQARANLTDDTELGAAQRRKIAMNASGRGSQKDIENAIHREKRDGNKKTAELLKSALSNLKESNKHFNPYVHAGIEELEAHRTTEYTVGPPIYKAELICKAMEVTTKSVICSNIILFELFKLHARRKSAEDVLAAEDWCSVDCIRLYTSSGHVIRTDRFKTQVMKMIIRQPGKETLAAKAGRGTRL